jgi:hypothetical protein
MLNVKEFELAGFKVKQMPASNGIENVILFDGGLFRTAFRWGMMNYQLDLYIRENVEKIKTLVYNKIPFEDKAYASVADLREYINKNYKNYTPLEKLDDLLLQISKVSKYDGDVIEFSFMVLEVGEFWRLSYFKNYHEFKFYLENLREKKLVVYDESKDGLHQFRITLDGLSRLADMEKRFDSRYCFVAMSFDADDRKIVFEQGIEPALRETNFLPLVVGDSFIDADKTINDEIIAGIKRSRFTIADFTKHRAGVYFEAGYALGRGQNVIYTCREDHIEDAHFDTRNFQHIVWKDAPDLKAKLVARIRATIIA